MNETPAGSTDNTATSNHSAFPIVARDKVRDTGLWVFIAILAIGAVALFAALSSNRTDISAPATTAVEPDPSRRIASPPPLSLPQEFSRDRPRVVRGARDRLPPFRAQVVARPEPASGNQTQPPRPEPAPDDQSFSESSSTPDLARTDDAGQSSIIFDRSFATSPSNSSAASLENPDRVTASRLARPSLTVPKGTVIPAVLETALDSTRPGAARALVQLDIKGFDGTRILIDRGSRLYGEYEGGLEYGEKRALIRWTRLIRPDGVIIALDSPSSDPLGRAGVRGKVDGKFFQRFGGAILQSVLDLGVGVATREATDGVIVALPGSTQNVTGSQQNQVQPTLKVKQGTSVSVFVARDLDFSTVDS